MLESIEEDTVSAIDPLAIVGSPTNVTCPTCRADGAGYVERESLLPLAHRDGCKALAAERLAWRDDLVQSATEGAPFHRPVDGVEVELGAALGLDVDGDALARVEVLDGRRVRTLPLTGSTGVVVTP